MAGQPRAAPIVLALRVAVAVLGLAVGGMTWLVFTSDGMVMQAETASKSRVPPLRYDTWYALPVQEGRIKPFQSASQDAVRQITGRTMFEGHDPVALLLAWMLTAGAGAAGGYTDWETHPFILCEHRGLRRAIYEDEARATGKYVAPADLRRSLDFDHLAAAVARQRKEHGAKAHFYLSAEELRAEEVSRRLLLFDALCGRSVTRLAVNALVGGKFLDLHELAELEDASPDTALERYVQKQRHTNDSMRFAALDRAPGAAWFSTSELLVLQHDPPRWRSTLRDRLAEAPQHYLSPEHLAALRDFQTSVQAGKGQAALDELTSVLQERRATKMQQFVAADRAGESAKANALFHQIVRTTRDQERLQQKRARQEGADAQSLRRALEDEMRALLTEADDRTLARLHGGLAAASRGERRGGADFSLLYLDYLEERYPEIYAAAASQPFPAEDVQAVLDAWADVRSAYQSGDTARFDAASTAFFQTVGLRANAATISLELLYNRAEPFRWAGVLMFASALAFLVGLALQRRFARSVALGLALLSLAVQGAGFWLRMAISGWAPVSNMFESVVFAAFVAGVLALALELADRRCVIGLAGAAVATFGLILADQLPLALDPKISPLVPVLRTNYWLTVHVLTIVCGYGAGALAWGLGNLSLAILAFGRDGRLTLPALGKLTYRTMQGAVLLLAAGTFLGGWWAAESWGRFWGWDPKEVGALIALVCYVVPLHARYVGWVKDFGLAVSAVLCFGAIVLSWYVVNFVLAAGLHSYGFGLGGGRWVLWAALLNIEWVAIAALIHHSRAQKMVAGGGIGS